jgi:hypothetical protein
MELLFVRVSHDRGFNLVMKPLKSWSERKGYIRDDPEFQRENADDNSIDMGTFWLLTALSLLALGLIGVLILLIFDWSVLAA